MLKPLSICLLIFASANAVACEKYNFPATTLTGTIHLKTFYGPPNFGEDPKTDAKERQAILHLAKPLCTVETDNDPAEQNQMEVTLAPMGKVSLKSFIGKKVTVTGSLYSATSGHHHTPVLIAIEQPPQLAK
jgi:hypothetical protein